MEPTASSQTKRPARRRVDETRLSNILRNNVPMVVGYRDRPVVDVGHVEPALADSAHCVWTEGNLAKIYLGSARAAGTASYESLAQAGVGAIINCTPHIPCHHRSQNIRYCQVPVRDHTGADILTYLPGATTFIDFHLRQGTSVLVHCEMGVSRSATVVLMTMSMEMKMPLITIAVWRVFLCRT